MSLHYDAFISYRHSEQDSRIADEIQTQLERYPIPKAIRQKTGKQKISRIFRDKNELPISSNLSDNISEALQNSDFLIVICSQRTRESFWVPREIGYFLQSHDMNHVLTVLVDGEPEEVIPDILKKRQVTRQTEDGQEVQITEIYEPLSCDYRLPIKRARKEELPRLASVLIGCAYDELVRRELQYKRKRTAIIGSAIGGAALVFMGYLLWSRIQIQENYRQSLVRQSEFLANESERILADDSRITAAQLAMAALPQDDKDDRPVVPAAEYALQNAVGAYIKAGNITIADTWKFSMDNQIREFVLDDDFQYLAAYDQANTLMVWDLQTFDVVYRQQYINDDVILIDFVEDDGLVIVSTKGMHRIQTTDWTVAWEKKEDIRGYAESNEVAVSADGKMLACEVERDGKEDYTTEYDLLVTSLEDGSEIALAPMPAIHNDDYDYDTPITIGRMIFSGDGKEVVIVGGSSYLDGYQLYHMNIAKGSLTDYPDLDMIYTYVGDMMSTKDGKVIISGLYTSEELRNSSSGFSGVMTIYQEVPEHVNCLDAASGKLEWTSDVAFSKIANSSGRYFREIDYDKDGEDRDAVIGAFADTLVIFDIKDGSILRKETGPSAVTSIAETKDGNTLQFITRDGELLILQETDQRLGLTAYSAFLDGLEDGRLFSDPVGGTNRYLIQKNAGRDLFLFEYGFHDSDFAFLQDADLAAKTSGEGRIYGRYFLEYNSYYDEESNRRDLLNIYDLDKKEQTGELELPSGIFYGDPEFAAEQGEKDGKNYVDFLLNLSEYDREKELNYCIERVYPEEGRMEEIRLPIPEDSEGLYASNAILRGGKVYFVSTVYGEDGETGFCIYRCDPETGHYDVRLLKKKKYDQYGGLENLWVSEDGQTAVTSWKIDADGQGDQSEVPVRLMVTNLKTGDDTDLEDVDMIADLGSDLMAAFSEDNQMVAVADEQNVFVLDTAGSVLATIPSNGREVKLLHMKDKWLYIGFDDSESDYIYRYQIGQKQSVGDEEENAGISGAAFAGRIQLEAGNSYGDLSTYLSFSPDGKEMDLFYGGNLFVIDMDYWEIRTAVEDCVAYDRGQELLLCPLHDEENDGSRLGYYKRYTWQELEEKARILTRGREIDEELRMQYGLE